MLNDAKIGFIGAGMMGEAMIKGLLDKGLVEPYQIIASDVRPERIETLHEWYDIHVTLDNREAAAQADVLVLAVKPQMLGAVLKQLRGAVKPSAMVLSIVAGATIGSISRGLAHKAVVRTMPNTPAQIGEGITVWTATPEVSEAQRSQAEAILSAFGEHLHVDHEDYLDMATALSGTGPAYVFLFMEALIDAGVHLGFPRHVAEKLVMQTMRGSIEYADYSTRHPARLRNQVTSPGGTSAEAIYHLEKGRLRTVISRAVWAAYQRSVALGGGASKGGRLPDTDADDNGLSK